MYAVTIALNHQKTGRNLDRLSAKIISNIPKYNWDGIDFPASIPDYKIFANPTIALNILYIPYNEQEIRPEYISKYNFTRKNQVIFFTITDDKETWHFLALKSIPTEDGYMKPTKILSQLMEGKSSSSHENYYCYGCFHSFRCESTLQERTLLCKDHNYCKINLPKKGKNYKKHKFGIKSLRMNDTIYLYLECLLRKYDSCSTNPDQSSTEKVAYHEVCGHLMAIVRNHTKKTISTYHRGKMLNLINVERKPMIELIDREKEMHDNFYKCYICNKSFIKDKKHKYYKSFTKAIDHDHYTGRYRGAAHILCNLRYGTQVDIPVVIHNGSNYDVHLLITELAKEFRAEINVIGETTEKYISFSIPIRKEREDDKFTTYNLKFMDSARFIAGSLDTHVNNLSELYDCYCENKKKQRIRIKCKKQIVHKRCKTCKKRSKQPIQSLKDKFPNTYKICNDDINKFLLLLRKGVYPYEYMDSWERFNEEQLPSLVKFYSQLNPKHSTKDDYKHAQKVWNTFNIRNLSEYHDLYVQSDTLQFANVFEKFRNLYLKEYKLDPAYFVTKPGLAMEACLKMTGVILELLTDIDMLLMFEKGIRGGTTQAIHRYATANNKYIPNYNKDL